MAFNGKCVIHNNSPRLWRILIAMGIQQSPIGEDLFSERCIAVVDGLAYPVAEIELPQAKLYDCLDNETLFFAIAALRDDSDINQWFIYDNRSWNDKEPLRFWFKCKTDDIADDMCIDQMYNDCDKATLAELIYHFTGQDDDEEATEEY